MKKASVIISVSEPCHESWDAMTLAEQGRFCQNCKKTVTDFSGMSDQEIISFFSSGQNNICGRFHPTQLNRKMEQPIVNKRSRKPFAAMITLVTALTISIPSVKAQKKVNKVYIAPDKNSKGDTTITSVGPTGFKRIEILPLGVSQTVSIMKVDSPRYNLQHNDSCISLIMGGVASGIQIEPEESVWRTIKTSIFDFF